VKYLSGCGKKRAENVITSVVFQPVLIAKLSVAHISTFLCNTKSTPNFSVSDNLITEGDAESLWFVIGYLSAGCGMSS
jgi:hypothetical protein